MLVSTLKRTPLQWKCALVRAECALVGLLIRPLWWECALVGIRLGGYTEAECALVRAECGLVGGRFSVSPLWLWCECALVSTLKRPRFGGVH